MKELTKLMRTPMTWQAAKRMENLIALNKVWNAGLVFSLYKNNNFIQSLVSRHASSYPGLLMLFTMADLGVPEDNKSLVTYIISTSTSFIAYAAMSNQLPLACSSLAYMFYVGGAAKNSVENKDFTLLTKALAIIGAFYHIKSEFAFMCQDMQRFDYNWLPAAARYLLVDPLPTGVQPWMGTALGSVTIVAAGALVKFALKKVLEEIWLDPSSLAL
jgi:hypothetical protein